MATELARLQVALEANTVAYEKGLKDVNRRLKAFEKTQTTALKRMTRDFKAFGKGLIGAVAGGAAINSLRQMTLEFSRFGLELENTARRLGVSAAALASFDSVAVTAGVPIDTLRDSLKDLQERTSEAVLGTGEAAEAFHQLGLSAKVVNDLPLEQKLQTVAEALNKVENEGDKARLAIQIMADNGYELLPVLDGLAEGALSFGNSIGGETAENLSEMGKALARLRQSFDVLAQTLIAKLAPAVIKVSDLFAALFRSVSGRQTDNEIAQQIQFWEAELVKLQKRLEEVQGTWHSGWRASGIEKSIEEARAILMDLRGQIQERADERADAGGGAPSVGSELIPLETTKRLQDQAKGVRDAWQKTWDEMTRKSERYYKQLEAGVESIEASLMSEEEALSASYDRKFAMLEDAERRNLLTKEKYKDLEEKLNAKYETDSADLVGEQKQKELGEYSNFFGQLTTLTESENAKLNAIHKAAAITQVIISGAAAIMKAYEAEGPFAGAVGAALMSGITAIQVATIAGARAMGGPVSGGSAYLVGERGPELFTPGASGTITPNDKLGGTTINIIEDASKAGRVEKSEDKVSVYVSAVMNHLQTEFTQGRGLFNQIENKYGLVRR